MADFSDEFKTRLKSVSDVTALVGTGTSARVYSDVRREGCDYPCIVYYESGGTSVEHLGGCSGLVRCVMHVLTYGLTRASANNLAEVIRTKAMNPTFKGNFGATYVTQLSASRHRNYGFEPSTDGGYRYWTERVYDIWHAEDMT